MKINPGWRPLGKDIVVNENPIQPPAQTQNFSDMLKNEDEQASYMQLRQMLEQIDIQGERLVKSTTIRELRLYKRMIRRFLEETVRRGIELRLTKGLDRRGRAKRYKILQEVDGVLLEMGDKLLLSEQGKIEILEHAGEIRGLLINLFF